MEEYSLSFARETIEQVRYHDSKVTGFFDAEIRLSDEDELSVESLQKFKPIYRNMKSFIDESIEEMKAMEVMGIGLDEVPESEEEEALLLELMRAIHVLTAKIEIILEFFLDNLGQKIVVDVLEIE